MSNNLIRVFLQRDGAEPVLTWVDERGRDETTRTVADLRARAGAVAAALRDAGVAPGEVVALVYPPGPAFLDGFLGALFAGAVPAPLYPPDPLRDDERGELLVRLAGEGVRVALTNRSYNRMRMLGQLRKALSRKRRTGPRTWIATDALKAGRGGPQPVDPSPDTVALLQLTSGSTSAPKGVQITHGNLTHQLEMNRDVLGLGPETRGVAWVPQYHDLGLVSCMLSAVFGNGRLWMMSPLAFLQRPALWMEVAHRVRATATAAPDFGYALVSRKTEPAQRRAWDLSCLKVAMSAGEPVRPATQAAFIEAFAASRFPPEACCPAYGLAEHTVGATLWGSGVRRFDTAGLQARRLTEATAASDDATALYACGTPAPGVELAIVGLDDGRRLGQGEIGEIWLRSPSVARGYRGLSELSAERFDARLEGDGASWLRTGDLGGVHDGELYVTGRLKDLVIVGGRNVYPEDVEDTIRRIPSPIGQAIRPGGIAAVGLERDGTEALGVAVEIVRGTPAPRLGEVVAEIAATVARRHRLHCEEILLLPQGSLPKTTSGKLRRSAVAEAWANGSLPARALFTASPTAPAPTWRAGLLREAVASGDRDAVRAAVLTLLAREAAVAPDAIRADVPLLDQGFDSIRLVGALTTMREDLGAVALTRALADAHTPEELVARLVGDSPEGTWALDGIRLAAPPDLDAPIAVIGAGPAGLAAALALNEQGYRRVEVFESADRVGGKVATATVAEGVYETGQLVGTSDYARFIRLVEELDLGVRIMGSPVAILGENGLEPVEQSWQAAISWLGRMRAAWDDTPPESRDVPLGRFIEAHGLETPPLGIRTLWTGCGYGHLHDAVPMRRFVEYFEVVRPGPTFCIEGGNDTLWRAVEERLREAGVAVHLGTRAVAVGRETHGCRLVISGGAEDGERTLHPAAVLLAVPPSAVQRILQPDDPIRQLAGCTVCYDYRVTAFRAPEVTTGPWNAGPSDTTDAVPANPVLVAPAEQAPGIWLSYWFARTPYRGVEVTPEAHEVRLRALWRGAGLGEIEIAGRHAWPGYFPHFSAEHDARCRAVIPRLQGADRLWALGGWVAGETVEQVVRHAQDIVRRDFSHLDAAGPPDAETAPAPPEDGWPLTPSQQQFLGFHALAPHEPMVTMVTLLWLDGWGDTDALARGVEVVLERTDDLRLTLTPAGDRVTVGPPGPLTRLDLRGRADAEERFRALAKQAARTPFEEMCGRAPVDVTLARFDGDRHGLCVRANHAFFDGPSLGRLMRRLLDTLGPGGPEAIPRWPSSQARGLADPASWRASERFWRELLRDVPDDPDAPLPGMREAHYTTLPVALERGRRLLLAARGMPLRLSALHIASVAVVRAARRGDDVVLLRVPVNLAPAADATILGCHVLIVPFPLRLDRSAPASALWNAAETRLVDVIRHARVSPALIEEAAPGPLPMGPSVNTWTVAEHLREGDLRLSVEQIHSGRQADLFESVWAHDVSRGRLSAWARYSLAHHDQRGVEHAHEATLRAAEALSASDPPPLAEVLAAVRAHFAEEAPR